MNEFIRDDILDALQTVIDPDLKKFFQKMAETENRNLSNFIINAVLTYIKDHKGIEDWRQGKNNDQLLKMNSFK